MELTGTIKKIYSTKEYGANGFKKREFVLTTEEQYPQDILINFVQDKCSHLDSRREGQKVKVSINIRGREWVNPEGETKYFNEIQAWRLENITPATENVQQKPSITAEEAFDKEPDDLPF